MDALGFESKSFKGEQEVMFFNQGLVPNLIRKGIQQNELRKLADLGGSTNAELMRDLVTGEDLVMKRGASVGHIQSEFAANKLYKKMGVAVPEAEMIADDTIQLTEFIKGETLASFLRMAGPGEREAVFAQLQDNFARIALMADWDALGLVLDNVMVTPDLRAVQIDSGRGTGL